MLSMTSDYAADTGSPEPYLKGIADAGFSHVHWCHQWSTDFLYSAPEIEQIQKWLQEFGLELLDLHASGGQEKNWWSSREYERLAGVELVRNRIEMTAALSADVAILHVPESDPAGADLPTWRRQAGLPDPVRRSLDELAPFAADRNVQVAFENTARRSDWETIGRILSQYGDAVGLCYDSGHGNIDGHGLGELESLRDRLISVHLHDNDGSADQHSLPFTGTIDWAGLTRIIAQSSYAKCVNLETTMRNAGIEDERAFLRRAFEAGCELSRMIESAA